MKKAIAAALVLLPTLALAEVSERAAIEVCGRVLSSSANVPAHHSDGFVKHTPNGGAVVYVTIDFAVTGRERRRMYQCRFNPAGKLTAVLDENDHYLYP